MGDLIKNNNFHGISGAFETEAMEQALEDASTRLGRPDGFTTKKSFAPSGVGYGSGRCPRYWYLAFHGANFKYSNTARQRANMDAGTAAGERIASLFQEAGLLNDAESKVIHEDPPVFGFLDLDVKWQGEDMIGEVKTTRDESFQMRASAMKAPGYQMIQLLLYMHILKREKGFFIIENKNTHELLILPIKMTPERQALVDYVLDWMRTVKKASDENQLPNRPFTPKSMECKSCPVWDDCWNGYTKKTAKNAGSDPAPGVVDLPPLEVPK